jgi:hypothetical protein
MPKSWHPEQLMDGATPPALFSEERRQDRLAGMSAAAELSGLFSVRRYAVARRFRPQHTRSRA